MQRLRAAHRLALCCAITLAGACGTMETSNEPIPQGMDLAVSGGGGQSGPPGTTLATPISVHVMNATGGAVEGVLVTWTVVGASGSVAPATSMSDANGNATTVWTLGSDVGPDSLRASLATGEFIVIIATATNGTSGTPGTPAMNMVMVSGNAQTVSRLQTSAPLVVRVTDAGGAPRVNAAVSWSITGPGGVLSSTSTTTNANGETQVTVTTSSSSGTYTITAASGTAASLVFTMHVP